jgi:hypothetical protein
LAADPVAPFAVFAVFPGNLQRATGNFWRKSWARGGEAAEKTAKRSLFFRCFSLFFSNNAHSQK